MQREVLLELRAPIAKYEAVGLRPATMDDFDQVMPVHAQMALDESGVNPLEKDPVGFCSRVARRIGQGRVWVSTDRGRLVFKADVVSRTPEVIYIEGVYINPEQRGEGQGLRFISQLSRTLLASTGSLCLLVNARNQAAQICYRNAGYERRAYYDTIYLQPNTPGEDNGEIRRVV
jgi:hypothetical protein